MQWERSYIWCPLVAGTNEDPNRRRIPMNPRGLSRSLLAARILTSGEEANSDPVCNERAPQGKIGSKPSIEPNTVMGSQGNHGPWYCQNVRNRERTVCYCSRPPWMPTRMTPLVDDTRTQNNRVECYYNQTLFIITCNMIA